jgi:hypothetical protein
MAPEARTEHSRAPATRELGHGRACSRWTKAVRSQVGTSRWMARRPGTAQRSYTRMAPGQRRLSAIPSHPRARISIATRSEIPFRRRRTRQHARRGSPRVSQKIGVVSKVGKSQQRRCARRGPGIRTRPGWSRQTGHPICESAGVCAKQLLPAGAERLQRGYCNRHGAVDESFRVSACQFHSCPKGEES